MYCPKPTNYLNNHHQQTQQNASSEHNSVAVKKGDILIKKQKLHAYTGTFKKLK